jgi:hypothetical protein
MYQECEAIIAADIERRIVEEQNNGLDMEDDESDQFRDNDEGSEPGDHAQDIDVSNHETRDTDTY